jgi:GTP-binding protein
VAQRERWLVLNKKDLLLEEEFEECRRKLVEDLGWDGPVYEISALNGDGTQALVYALMEYLEEHKREEQKEVEPDDEPWDPTDS